MPVCFVDAIERPPLNRLVVDMCHTYKYVQAHMHGAQIRRRAKMSVLANAHNSVCLDERILPIRNRGFPD